MKHPPKNMKELLQGLAEHEMSLESVAVLFAHETGKPMTRQEVNRVLTRWLEESTRGVPRGNALKIVRITSAILGQPVSPAVGYLFSHVWTRKKLQRTSPRQMQQAA